MANIAEVRPAGATVVAVCDEGDDETAGGRRTTSSRCRP